MKSAPHVPVPVVGAVAAAVVAAFAILLVEVAADGPALPDKTRPLILMPHPKG
ncbi:hypothetical protein [Arenibaculum sp.]|uniref:hypothetical protein n=1 Tax=Arenibaculum sp. TaxID=2865862 RepID=UPI002E1337A6